MEVKVNTHEADSLKLKWAPVAGKESTWSKMNEQGEILAYRISDIPNTGTASLELPSSLLNRNDAETSIAARPLERLKNYTEGYGQLGLYALIAGVVLVVISPFVRKLMREVN